MARKKVPEINGGPMADIAFLLLIFFLVATTMDTDTGLTRQMPPLPDEEQQDDNKKIKDRNVFEVLISSQDRLLVEGEPTSINDLREATKEFIANPQNKSDLPEKVVKEIPYFGQREVPKNAIISLKNDRGTSYSMYIKVQNELVAAYNELRNSLAQQSFGKKYDQLDKDKQQAIKEIYPQVISEAEPVNIGGN